MASGFIQPHVDEALPSAFAHALFHDPLVSVLFVDANHKICAVNARASELAPKLLQRPLLAGQDFRDFLVDADSVERYARVCNGEEVCLEWKAPDTIDGKPSWHLVRFSPVWEERQQIGMCLTAFDVTEVHLARNVEVASRERILSLVKHTSDILRIEDDDGRITFISPAVETILGYRPEELLGKRWAEFVHPEDAEQGLPLAESVRAEQRVRRADGSYVHLECRATKLEPTDDDAAFVVSSREVSQRVLAENDLRSARDRAIEVAKLKSEFLANVSHEIRTPMNAVIGMTSLLLDSDLKEEQRHYTEIVKHSAESLLTLINDILDFAKIEAGKMQVVNSAVDLRSLVEEVFSVLAESAGRKGVELVYWADLDFPQRIQADEDKLRRILTNLVGNAVKFTHEGHVLVRLRMKKLSSQTWQANIEVSDTGIGIAPQAQENLFRAFSQVDGSATRKYGGTGLGLAICKQLVQLMGGRIAVESTPGIGSRFFFSLPLRRDAVQSNPVAPNKKRICIVTNQPTVGLALSRLLTEDGFQEVSVIGPEQAMRGALSGADCVVADFAEGCIGCAEQLHALPCSQGVVLVPFACKELNVPEGWVKVRKPIRRSTVRQAIRETLGMPQESHERSEELELAAARLAESFGIEHATEALGLLRSEADSILQGLHGWFVSGDFNQAKDSAARLESGCCAIGAPGLQALAKVLRKACEQLNEDDARDAAERLRLGFEAALRGLNQPQAA